MPEPDDAGKGACTADFYPCDSESRRMCCIKRNLFNESDHPYRFLIENFCHLVRGVICRTADPLCSSRGFGSEIRFTFLCFVGLQAPSDNMQSSTEQDNLAGPLPFGRCADIWNFVLSRTSKSVAPAATPCPAGIAPRYLIGSSLVDSEHNFTLNSITLLFSSSRSSG